MLQIIICTILILVTAIYSRAWSLNGNGIELNIWVIIIVIVLIIIAGVIGYFSMLALNIIADILSWIIGTFGIMICVMEIVFLFKIRWMSTQIKVKMIKFNLLYVTGFIVGLGIIFGWWFSGKNWIMNDIVFVCVAIAVIKIFKFVNFKTAVISFIVFIVIELVFVIVIYYVSR